MTQAVRTPGRRRASKDIHKPDRARSQSRATARFPELAPANFDSAPRPMHPLARMATALGRPFRRGDADPPELGPEAHDPQGRILVYLMNTALLFLAFPVGFALLLHNVMAGENLRTTAHVVALTGLGMILLRIDTIPTIAGI